MSQEALIGEPHAEQNIVGKASRCSMHV